MGYCMGCSMTCTAAVFDDPDRSRTARDDSPGSPPCYLTGYALDLFAIAENDAEGPTEAKTVLRDVFAAAGLPAEIEVYAGTLHGWCPPDSAVYHEAQAERAWSRLLALFETALARE